jgi:hypothetical protein
MYGYVSQWRETKIFTFLVFEQLEAGFLQHTEMSEYGREKHVVAAKF